MGKMLTRQEAWELLTRYTKTPSLQKHALAVEAVMKHFAKLNNEDVEIMQEEGIDDFYIHAVCSHGYGICSDVKPEHIMEKVLFTIDELTGLINALCLMRPSKSVLDLEVKSVKKKFKDKSFASGVNRQIVKDGCEMLGMSLDEVIKETIEGMKTKAEAIGLKGNL